MLDTRLCQLHTHHTGNRAANDPRENRKDQIERADILVVGRHEPAGEKARLVVRIMPMIVMGSGDTFCGSCHSSDTLWSSLFVIRRALLRRPLPRRRPRQPQPLRARLSYRLVQEPMLPTLRVEVLRQQPA